MLEADAGQSQQAPVYGNAGSGSYAAPAPSAPSGGVPPPPSAGGGLAVNKAYASAPLSAPPKLSSKKIDVREQSRSVGYFLFGASLAAIVASLLTASMKAQKAAAVSQLQREYENEIQVRLNDKMFKSQEKKVKEIGSQVTVLKNALSDRVMFSKFFLELEKVTYKKARFVNISASKENTVTLTGTVADFVDLSKTVSALKTSTVFEEIDLASVELDKEKNLINFSIQIKLDPSLLKIDGQKATAKDVADRTATDETSQTDSALPETNANISSTGTVIPDSPEPASPATIITTP